jgi:branched-chain amino acid transport system substrate-binding protein
MVKNGCEHCTKSKVVERRTKMKRNSNAMLWKVLILFAVFSLTGLYSKSAMGQSPPYKIGVVLSLSGPLANAAKGMLAADEIAAEEFNKAGGILGRKIELEVRDDQFKVETAVRMTRELIERHKVGAILGTLPSHCTLGMMSVTSEHNIPHITACSNSEMLVIQAFKRNYFQVSPNTYMEALSQLKFVTDDPKLKTYGTFCSDYEWGRNFAAISKEILAKERPNIKLVGQWWPPVTETQFTGYITAMLTAKPDCILSAIGGGGYPAFVKQAKQYGFFEKIKFIQSLFINEMMALGKEMPEGIYAVNRNPFYATKTPKMKAFIEKYYKKEGIYPDEYAIMTYDSFHALMTGIKKANSFDSNLIIAAMENMTFEACAGERFFRKVDHQMNSPHYIGVTAYVPEYPFTVLKNIRVVTAEESWRSPEEVLRLRKAGGK